MPETKILNLEFICIDEWSRPVWKVVDKQVYFCSVDCLIPNRDLASHSTSAEINEHFKERQYLVVLLGGNIDDDPDGRKADHWEYNFVNDGTS